MNRRSLDDPESDFGESKRPRLDLVRNAPLSLDPEQIWIMAPGLEDVAKLAKNFSIHNLNASLDLLTVFGWMLDGQAPHGQLDRWSRLFTLVQEIRQLHNLPTAVDPVDISQFANAGQVILFFKEDELACTEHALFRRIFTQESTESSERKESVDDEPKFPVDSFSTQMALKEQLQLLTKASSTIRFYRACIDSLREQVPIFTEDINPSRVRKAISMVADRLDPRTNDEYRKDMWSLHLKLGELCVYAQTTCSAFSRNIDVSAIVRRTPERSDIMLKDDFKSDSPEQQITDLWCFDLWLKTVCTRNPAFVQGNVITWRLHCREDSMNLLVAETLGMRSKQPVIVLLGQGIWVVFDTKQKIWSVFETAVEAIACFFLYTHLSHGSCFSNCVPLPRLPE